MPTLNSELLDLCQRMSSRSRQSTISKESVSECAKPKPLETLNLLRATLEVLTKLPKAPDPDVQVFDAKKKKHCQLLFSSRKDHAEPKGCEQDVTFSSRHRVKCTLGYNNEKNMTR